MSGEFPRKCGNGHYTYASDVTIAVALQPVLLQNGKIGLLSVQRNIHPYKYGFALPGGYVDHGEIPMLAAIRELSEETPIIQEEAVHFSEDIGSSHADSDPRCHVMHFYRMNAIKENEVGLGFCNKEVASLTILTLSENREDLFDHFGEQVTLCFSTHHNAALNFLKNY